MSSSRRRFIAGLLGSGSAAVAISLVGACAAQPRQRSSAVSPLIGYLGTAAAADPVNVNAVADFREGLLADGLLVDENVRIDWRWAEGRPPDWVREQTRDLVARDARVIVANGSFWKPAREATDSVPIVTTGANAEELIARGWASSVAKPGGTVTGLSHQANQIWRKRIEVLVAVVPTIRRLAVMTNLAVVARSEVQLRAGVEDFGLEALVLDVRTVADVDVAVQRAVSWGADAISVEGLNPPSLLASPVARAALESRLPTMCSGREVEVGGLMSYTASWADGYLHRRAAWFVARILGGTSPGDLPIELANVIRLAVNRKTLADLRLSLPPGIAAQVTDWIE